MSRLYSDKEIVQIITDIAVKNNLKRVVISPGSRNAPLSIAFARDERIETFVLVDERSAAFFALGMAQQSNEPVGLVCTSGTALLNCAPAVAEAYYQRIPLVVISADRPLEWIDQDDSQAIRQQEALKGMVKGVYQLPVSVQGADDRWYANRLVNEAFNTALSGRKGPVHLNIPFREPLYGLKPYLEKNERIVRTINLVENFSDDSLETLTRIIHSSSKILVLAGQTAPSAELQRALERFSSLPQVVVLTETISNLSSPNFITTIDRVITSFTEEELPEYMPELLISFGGPVVSKIIRRMIRSCPPVHHWYIGKGEPLIDTFCSLTERIDLSPEAFFRQLVSKSEPVMSDYAARWKMRDGQQAQKHEAFLQTTEWSDLKAFSILLPSIPQGSHLQVGNSSTVRYAQLFKDCPALHTRGNRGTSGIDGSSSTAAGASVVFEGQTILITGDMSFMYDSHAFWNPYLTSRFKVIVIKNGGGGIFRFIAGPSEVEECEQYFETAQEIDVERLADFYRLAYFKAGDEASLQEALPRFYAETERPAVLEVETPRQVNDRVLKAYFKSLQNK